MISDQSVSYFLLLVEHINNGFRYDITHTCTCNSGQTITITLGPGIVLEREPFWHQKLTSVAK